MKGKEQKLETINDDHINQKYKILSEDLDKTYASYFEPKNHIPNVYYLLSMFPKGYIPKLIKEAKLTQDFYRESDPNKDLHKTTVYGVFNTLHECYPEQESSKEATTFPIAIVGLVIFLAIMSGNKFLDDITEFWYRKHPMLHVLIPNLPSLKLDLSFSTLNNSLRLLNADAMKDVLNEYFSVFDREIIPQELKDKFDVTIPDMTIPYEEYDHEDDDMDDEKLNSSEKPSSYRQLLAPLWSMLSVLDDYVYIKSPFSYKKEVLEKLNGRRFEYVASVDNKIWYDIVDSAFKQFYADKKSLPVSIESTSTKLQDWTFTFIPASTVFKRKTFPKNIRTLLCLKKTVPNNQDQENTLTLVNTDATITKYYICSLKYSEKDKLMQAVKGFEYYQDIPDTIFMQDASYPAEDSEEFVGFDYDWMLYEILAYFRELNPTVRKQRTTYQELIHSFSMSIELALGNLAQYFALGAPEPKKRPRSLPAAVTGNRSRVEDFFDYI